jgi:hypothetical protein
MDVNLHARPSRDHRPLEVAVDHYPMERGTLTTLRLTLRNTDGDYLDTITIMLDTLDDVMALGAAILEAATTEATRRITVDPTPLYIA